MPASRYFLEVPAGTEVVARAELQRLGAKRLAEFPGGFRLVQDADLAKALRARTLAAAYLSMTFPVPRPKALLGDASFRALVAAVKGVAARGEYGGLRFSAAGADSPTMTRLASSLAAAVGLPWRQDDGELLVRLRPDPAGAGWEVLVRLTPRPSSTRAWRVCNRPGGLNAAVAAAMNELAGVDARDAYLNLMCGSGTLLIERALRAPARKLVGFDVDPDAVRCAETNASAAGVAKRCELGVGDLTDPRFVEWLGTAGRFDVLTADAPWGDAVGAHAANRALYPKLFAAAAALAAPDARFCLLSHELRLLRSVVLDQPWWRVEHESQVAHGGHHPLVLLMSRAQE
ncbi:MAG: methyltransferase domain-containing protein [Trueperaceae bacterium]|nr:methyltransferase domain-containing protein [Trueperaceae bacterium]